MPCFYAICTYFCHKIIIHHSPSTNLRNGYFNVSSRAKKTFFNVWLLPAKKTLSMFGRYQQKRLFQCLVVTSKKYFVNVWSLPAKNTSPRMFDPSVNSPPIFQLYRLCGSLSPLLSLKAWLPGYVSTVRYCCRVA